jgi:hypothetical protein
MVNFPGRNGRRRRVLNEEVLSASSSHTVLRALNLDGEVRNAPRYSDAAGVEHHPQVTDFVPRRYRTIALLVVSGSVVATLLGTLNYFSAPIGQILGTVDTSPFDLQSPGSIADWVAAVILLVASVTCVLVYSIRRHRIDDYRGRYRVWLATAAACLFMSADSVVSTHDLLAHAAGHVTGWTALRDGAIWWLLLGCLPAAWIAARMMLDVKESRLAASLLGAGGLCYAASGLNYFGVFPAFDLQIASTVTGIALFMGHWLLLAAVVSYARFVVLDAQGLIQSRPRIVGHRKTKTASTDSSANDSKQPATRAVSLLSAGGYSRQRKSAVSQSPKVASSTSAWVDGSRPERDPYDDNDDDSPGDDRKLSKSDRKRLRKLKAQNRAA